jgi:hypothetical protein
LPGQNRRLVVIEQREQRNFSQDVRAASHQVTSQKRMAQERQNEQGRISQEMSDRPQRRPANRKVFPREHIVITVKDVQ